MANAQPEPSMEEILASIRRIISDDEPEADGAAADNASEDVSSAADEDAASDLSPARIFDPVAGASLAPSETQPAETQLSEKQGEAASASDERPTYAETPAAQGEDLQDFETPTAEAPSVSDPLDGAAADITGTAGADAEADLAAFSAASTEGIVAATSANVASDAFRSLTQTVRISGEGDKTLEDIVTALLTPLIKDWLDKNLPAIVEEKVQDEVQRIARRAR